MMKNILTVLVATAVLGFVWSGCSDDLDTNGGGDSDAIEQEGTATDGDSTEELTEAEPELDSLQETDVIEQVDEPQEQEYDVVITVPVCDGYPCGPYGTELGDIMENFTLKDCDGNEISLKDYFGNVKAVFINQSAGWCSACRAEADRLEQIYERFKDDGLILIQALFEDDFGNPADSAFCRSWRDQYDLTFPVVVDSRNLFGPYHPGWPNSMATPLNMLLDANMRIQFVVEGYTPQSIEGHICRLVGRDDCFEK